MKLLNKGKRCFRAAAVFLLCAALTGCMDRRMEFLEEGNRKEISEEAGKAAETQEEIKEALEITEIPEEPTVTPAEIYVDICGAVAEPGVFRMEEGSRVFQAVEAAGGYLPEAARQYVNGAGFIEDGQKIYVPTEEEAKADFPLTEEGMPAGKLPENGGDGRVNLNTADLAGLMTLTGIGEAKAGAILSYREEHGGFASIEEIMNVQGIKESTFQKIKDDISVG